MLIKQREVKITTTLYDLEGLTLQELEEVREALVFHHDENTYAEMSVSKRVVEAIDVILNPDLSRWG